MSPYRTQLNKTGVPGQVHTASVSPLYPLLSLFFVSSQSRKHTGRQPELTPATINSPSHSYLIMTKHCNSPGSTHGTLTGYSIENNNICKIWSSVYREKQIILRSVHGNVQVVDYVVVFFTCAIKCKLGWMWLNSVSIEFMFNN